MATSQSKPMTDLVGPSPVPPAKPRRAKAAAASAAAVLSAVAPAAPATVPISADPAKPKPRAAKKTKAAVAPVAPPPTPSQTLEAPSSPLLHLPIAARVTMGLIVVAIILAAGFEFLYAGRILPGVTADGVNLGGLSPAAAASAIAARVRTFNEQALTITYANSDLRIPVTGLAPTYNPTHDASLAAAYGRTGNLWDRAHQQLRTLFGRPTVYTTVSFNDSRLAPYLNQLDDSIATPVQNAALTFNGDHAAVTAAATGTRLDLGRLATIINSSLAVTSTAPIAAPIYQLAPDLATAPLQAIASQADTYLAGPLTLSYSGQTKLIDQSTLVSWIQVGAAPPQPFLDSLNLADLFSPPPLASLSLSHSAIQDYVTSLAQTLDQPAKNATLAMQNNQLAVTAPSQDGVSLDQTAAVTAITASLTKPSTDRTIPLTLASTPAAVNENNLASLGITQLISEGETYFPGSPADRLINVRAGAAKFNDVLLKPGQVFSFGALLGEVDASTGYVPELVIDGNHEDYQYGGGLCQVSTTAFRAALLAGLPINERVNHAFAISYYTWPYGVPGVDATLYYPQVDLKFTNDTGHYILIQTIMNGVDLKFDFYGTKTKSGVIRGPYFISGSNDATKASKTVFYRDVEDLTGNVIKTDTFNTSYQPSVNFPIINTFN